MSPKTAPQRTTTPHSAPPEALNAAGPGGATAAPPAYGIAALDGGAVTQRKTTLPTTTDSGPARLPNRTGLPDGLKAGVESLSGLSLNNVRVHYNSTRPARLHALAYTQGEQIYVAPGQERHLPHEAWHVVQQAQGRVAPTLQLKGVNINDDDGLEKEADEKGIYAAKIEKTRPASTRQTPPQPFAQTSGFSPVAQRRVGYEFEMDWMVKAPGNTIGMHTAIIQGNHWHTVPDMKPLPAEMQDERHYTGYGNLEFVTDAFDETQFGRVQLSSALFEITDLVKDIAKEWAGFTGWGDVRLANFVQNNIRWGNTVPDQRKQDIWVDRQKDASGLASPQMTAGIRLEKVHDVLSEMGQATPAGAPDIYGRAPAPAGQPVNVNRAFINAVTNRAAAQTMISLVGTPLNAAQQREYTSIVTLLGLVVALGRAVDVGTNEKYLSPFLSRTNFGLLPNYIRQTVSLRKDVLVAAGLANNVHDALAVNLRAQSPLFSASPHMNQMSIGTWLNNIVAGHDTFHWGQEAPLARWNPQQVGPPAHQGLGHVYEFRGVSGQKPVQEWSAWALDLFDHTRNTLNA